MTRLVRAIRIHEFGDESILRLEKIDRPNPDPAEVLIEVRAAAVNPFDTYVREGLVEPANGLPHVLGGDASGVVAAVGADVSGFEPGNRVFTTGLGLDRPGTYAEYVAVPDHRVAHLPASVGWFEGAAAAEPVTTGLQALARGPLQLDDVCLVQGATGGIGHAAAQLAREAGAFVVGTCRAEAADDARRFGVHAAVDYRSDDLVNRILEATDGRPVDVVVETHAAANVAADVDVLADGGTVVILGEDGPITIEKPVAGAAKAKQADLAFSSHMRATAHHGEALETAARLLDRGNVSAEVAATYPLEDAGEAQRRCLDGGTVGKVVLDVSAGR
ncbi:zinc-binding alcohol dehydrogenase family protein [Saliphagus sp. GCM10025317]